MWKFRQQMKCNYGWELRCRPILVSIAWLALVCLSCSEGKEEKGKVHPTAASIGQPSEVVLVLDDAVLKSDLKDSLEALLTCNVPGLNQGEDYFRLSRIPASMDQKEFLKMHSRVIARVDPSLKEPMLGIARDVRATPQLQIQLAGPSVDALRPFISGHAEQVRQMLLDAQLDNQTLYLVKHASVQVAKDLRATLGYTICAPEEIQFTKKGKDFLWGSSRTNEKQLNMVFYAIPYDGRDLRSPRVLAALRDSVMQANIPGSEPDQWMETVWDEGHPVVLVQEYRAKEEMGADSQFAPVLMRGLWQMRNGAMGGPFVSLFFVDEQHHNLVVAEGFVFSPQTTKRDLIRRLEAAIRTLSQKTLK